MLRVPIEKDVPGKRIIYKRTVAWNGIIKSLDFDSTYKCNRYAVTFSNIDFMLTTFTKHA